MQNDTNGDTSLIDGFEELDSESQEKISTALKEGHVADSDWKGVCVFFHLCALLDIFKNSVLFDR